MIATLALLVIVAACAALLFLKGTLAQGLAMIFNLLVAGFIAFGFFELLTPYLIKYSPGVAPWAPMICFLALLLVAFALLQAAAMQLSAKHKVDFGPLPEQIGRPVAGVILGYFVTGHLLVAAAMAPLPLDYPYPRFDERNPNPARPAKPLLNPDGAVTGLFATVSKGSFAALKNPRSFAVLHAGYVDQLYLNRQKIAGEVPLMTSTPALEVARKDGVWHAPESLRDTEGKPLPAQPGASLMLVRVGIKAGALKDAAKFTLSQIRLICGPKTGVTNPLLGAGQAVYPIGYIGSNSRLERKSLAEIIAIDPAKVQGNAVMMDLAFHVPTNLVPVLLEFKRNNVVQVSAPAASENAPQPIPFGSAPAPAAPPEPEPPAPQAAQPAPAPDDQRQGRGLSDFSRSIVGDQEN